MSLADLLAMFTKIKDIRINTAILDEGRRNPPAFLSDGSPKNPVTVGQIIDIFV